MRYGANTFIWASPFRTPAHLPLVERVAGLGFDVIEVALRIGNLLETRVLYERLRASQSLA